MPRLLKDWISAYIEYTKDSEAPLSYRVWSSVSLITSALQRKCHMQWGRRRIHPNMYIVLIGPSGHSRKGEALSDIGPFFIHLGLPLVAQSIIREALIRKIKDSTSQYVEDDTGKVCFHSSVSIVSSELQVFLGVKDTRFLSDLTDWYDSHQPVWTYETKHQGTDRIPGLCVSLLGATAPDWLPSILPSEAVGGGFTSRIIFIVEEQKGKTVSNPNLIKLDPELLDNLEKDIELIHLLKGEFKFSTDALDLYEAFYKKQDDNWKKGISPVPDPKFGGYVSRRATHIKKVCMAISASRGDSRIIEAEDFKRAAILLKSAEGRMSRAFAGVGKSRFAELTDGVLNYIMKKKSCKRSEILNRFYRDVDAWSLEAIERVLVGMKTITVMILADEDDVLYTFIHSDSSTALLAKGPDLSLSEAYQKSSQTLNLPAPEDLEDENQEPQPTTEQSSS